MSAPMAWWSDLRPRRHPINEIVVSDAHVVLNDPQYLIAELETIVVYLMQAGNFARADIPREALLAVAVSIYLGEAQNGGHAQVIANTHADPVLFGDIRDGLALLGLEAVRDVWSKFEAYQKRDPKKFMEADWRDPVLQSLDDALNPKLKGAFAHIVDQAVRWPFLRLTPGDEAQVALKAIVEG